MYDPIIHHVLRAYPSAALVKEPPFWSTAKLRCADPGKPHHIAHPDFGLSYCHYDGADTFIAVLEIHARTAVEFAVECSHHDLHGCYLEQGEVTASQGDDSLDLHTGQYALVYAPKGDYRVRIEAGMTVVRLWSTNNRTLKRDRDKKALSPLGTLLNLWVSKGARCHHSRVLPFSGPCVNIWDQLAILPHLRPLTMDNRLRELITDLIYCCIDALQTNRKDGNESLTLVHAVRRDIVSTLRLGEVPRVQELADKHEVVVKTMLRHHQRLYGTSIKKFISRTRLRQAHFLLSYTSLTVKEVAYTVGYGSEAEFKEAYKRQFNYLPSETPRRQ